MALPAELENLLAQITDTSKREATRKILNENHENGLRQSDYSRKQNELATQQANWRNWHKETNAQYLAQQDELKAAKRQAAQATSRIEELEGIKTSHGDDLSSAGEAQLARDLAAAKADLGKATGEVETLKRMVDEGELVSASAYDEDVRRRGDALGNAVLEIVDLQARYRDDYGPGKRLDRDLLVQEAHKHGGDLERAYQVITENDRVEKMKADLEKTYEAKYNDRLKSSNLPIDVGSGEPTLGPLQMRLQKKASTIPEDVAADGSGRLASLIAQELRQEGKY